MLAIVLKALLVSAAPVTSSSPAEMFVAAGEAHLRRAADGGALHEFEAAHKNFDSAYLVAEEPGYLCRALAVAELALRVATFSGEQERRSWEDLRRDDLARLRDDAEQAKRENCRFDASGTPRSFAGIALIDPEGPPPAVVVAPRAADDSATSISAPRPAQADRELGRPSRARTAAGAIVTSAGIGLLGGFAGVVALELQRAAELKGLIRTARAEERRFTEVEDHRARELGAELRRGRDMAIGLGLVGVVTLTTGIAVLATRGAARARRYGLAPYGGPRGAGVVLRLGF